ncbi:caspase family protein [Bradyrhizobium sp. SZCCHNS2022]|uniref:caspase family protein n=1 Tax=unclassified Bradyrhizobium TaxID=2631580 RepID=UPI0039657D13
MAMGFILSMGAILRLFVILTLISVWSASASAEKRIALVVGNSNYQNVTPLGNPRNDARLMAETLRSLGFSLVAGGPQIDLDKAAFDAALQKFGNAIMGADVALFYYAGHGVQVAGRNFLVPVAANPTKEADVYLQMVDTNVVLSQMDGAGTKLNIVVLDACRNNPFGGRGFRATGGGLAQMQAPEGTLISYATQPGNVALDGEGGNSPYSSALAATIRKPGLGLFEAFNEVGLAVKKSTGGAQQPWVSSSPIAGRFYFTGRSEAESPAAPAQPPVSAADRMREDFELAQKLGKREVWEAFLKTYPDGFYASIARSRLDEIKSKVALAAPSESLPPPPTPQLRSMAGVWTGSYSYANGSQVPFTFNFGTAGCAGRAEEVNTFGNRSAPKLFANLACSSASLVPGQTVTITKTYDGTGGVSHAVSYVGRISADLRSISGRWSLSGASGTFTMSR